MERYSASRKKVRKVQYLIAQVILRYFLYIWSRFGPISHALSAYHSGFLWDALLQQLPSAPLTNIFRFYTIYSGWPLSLQSG